MEKTYVVITARSRKSDRTRGVFGHETETDMLLNNEKYCGFLSVLVENICNELGITIIHSAFFEQNNSMALLARADATNSIVDIPTLRRIMEEAGIRVNSTIKLQKEDLFRYMHRI